MTPLATERFNSNKGQKDKSKQTTSSGTSLYQSGPGGGSSLYQGNQNSSSLYSGTPTAPAPVKGTTSKY